MKLGMGEIKRAYTNALDKINERIWSEAPKSKSRLPEALRYLAQLSSLLISQIMSRKLSIRAHALTYITLLSLLPLLALLLFVLNKLGLWLSVRDELLPQISAQSEQMAEIVNTAVAYIEQTNFNSLGIAGGFFLLSALVSVVGNIEKAFNEIWNVAKNRNYFYRFIAYLLVLIIVPLLISAGFSFSGFALELLGRYDPFFANIAGSAMSGIIQFAFFGLGFSLLLYLLPNTKVPLSSALASGYFCGLIYYIVAALYFGLQIGMANYNLVYSSLAALPVTFIFIDISWHIVLFGCELSFSINKLAIYRKGL